MGFDIVALAISLGVIAIPIVAIVLSHKRKTQNNDIKKLELQKEILQLENEKDNMKIKLLEEENKKLDKLIEGQHNGN